MNRILKRILFLMLIVCLIPANISFAKTENCKGTIPCQTGSLYWEFYASSGKLVIRGSGKISSSVKSAEDWAKIWGTTTTGATFDYKNCVKTVGHLSNSSPSIQFSNKNCNGMFADFNALTEVNVTGWKNDSVTSYYKMFYNCPNLKKITTDSGKTSDFFSSTSVSNISFMFYKDLIISNSVVDEIFPTGLRSLTEAKYTFFNCKKITAVPICISHKNTAINSKACDLSQSCRMTGIESITFTLQGKQLSPDVKWTTALMFSNCYKLKSVSINTPVTQFTNAEQMFDNCTSLSRFFVNGDADSTNLNALRLPKNSCFSGSDTAYWVYKPDKKSYKGGVDFVKKGEYLAMTTSVNVIFYNVKTNTQDVYDLTQASLNNTVIGGSATGTAFANKGYDTLVTEFYSDKECTSKFDLTKLGIGIKSASDGYLPSSKTFRATATTGYMDFDNADEITDGIVLYYSPEATPYSIKYVMGEGAVNDASNKSSYSVESHITFAPAKKTDYTFAGWYLDASFKEKVSGTRDFVALPTMPYEDKTIYAKFNCNHARTEIRNQVNPTSSAPGYTGDKWCLVCGRIIEQGVVIYQSSLSLNYSSVSIKKDTSIQLNADYYPTVAEISWKSDNSSVAKVNSFGKVTGLRKGSAVITCTLTSPDGITLKAATCKITVTQPVTAITLNRSTFVLKKGTTFLLKATIAPSNASKQSVTWTSSNKSVATVYSNGRVKALKNGITTITCKAKDGSGVTKTAKLMVGTPVTRVSLNKTKVTLSAGKAVSLKAQVLPSNATYPNVVWYTSNKSVATVTQGGYVKALKKGTCTITCKARDGSGKNSVCTITVK